MLQQVTDFASGLRKNLVPGRLPQTWMAHVAQAATSDEIASAVSYFASLKLRVDIRVVETDVVPDTTVARWTLAETKSGRTEPIGRRIIEVPEDLEQFENLDGLSRFVAYVPPGSIARGKAIATAGIPGTDVASCTSCHMADLRGIHFIPPLAGRSPSYAVRQLWDMKYGARTGPGLPPMARVARALDLDAMIAVAAYAASLPP
jgi:cytochrome c553